MMGPLDRLAAAVPEVRAALESQKSPGSHVRNEVNENEIVGQQALASARRVKAHEGVKTCIKNSEDNTADNEVGSCHQGGGAVEKRLGVGRRVSVSRIIHSDSDLPRGHTYQPYFWISRQAQAHCKDFLFKWPANVPVREAVKSWIIGQLTMSEQAAKEYFKEHFEYRFVDYGFTSCDKSSEVNYGLFAKTAVKKHQFLGVYSGVGYLFSPHIDIDLDFKSVVNNPKLLYSRFDMPDFMSYCRTLLAGLDGKEQEQRTLMKYINDFVLSTDEKKVVRILPDNERYTPMHFVNSANKISNVNVEKYFIPLNTGSGQYHVPVFRAIKAISVGQEILSDYMLDKVYKASALATAEQECNDIHGLMARRLNFLESISKDAGLPAVSKFVHAPVIYVSEDLRNRGVSGQVKTQHRR